MQIEDGTGKGFKAAVTPENMVKTRSVTETTEHHANVEGNAYNMIVTATPTGAGDCFLYLKNTDDAAIIIEGMTLKLAASEYIDIKLGDSGTPVGGTGVTPANLNSASGESATGTFEGGADITGLSGGVTVDRIHHLTSAGRTDYNFEQDIILPKNGVFTMYAQTGTTEACVVLNFSYHADCG